MNQVTRIRAAHNSLANRKELKVNHVECSSRWIQEDENMCKILSFAFLSLTHFHLTHLHLHLQSAMPASDKLIADLNSAYAAGEVDYFSVRQGFQQENLSMNMSL